MNDDANRPARPLPIIHGREMAADDPRRETLDLEFSNGERRRYTRVSSGGHGSVIIAALPDPVFVGHGISASVWNR